MICPLDPQQQQLFASQEGSGRAASRLAVPLTLNGRRMEQPSTWSTPFSRPYFEGKCSEFYIFDAEFRERQQSFGIRVREIPSSLRK